MKRKIDDIINSNLCLGCGLCETIVGKARCEMKISSEGFYRPSFKSKLNEEENNSILTCCPGIHIQGTKHANVWGNVLNVVEAWSTDDTLRKKSATGGVISSFAVYLLESEKVDAILHVGVKKNSWLYNELLVSKTKEDVILNAQSRYAPALVFNKIKDILDASSETYCFIGKPCDIAGIKNFIKVYPQYKYRIKYTLAIFCAGIPSYNATKTLVAEAKVQGEPSFIKYRGDGWPGEFEVRWQTGQSFKISYNESWGKVLGKTLGMRCKICPDGIGLLADISTGDSWNTKNGYPDFTEADGRNFCFIRNQKGNDLFNAAVKAGYLTVKELNITSIKDMHHYQYTRRIFSGWRILAVQLLTVGLLQFKGLGLVYLLPKSNPLKGVKEFVGTIKRFG